MGSIVCRSPDGGTVRNMDWIYRNIPGAKVSRRTHQSLDVPVIPGQRQYQTLVNIVVQEFEGGYQDRTGARSPSPSLSLARSLALSRSLCLLLSVPLSLLSFSHSLSLSL